MKFDTFLILRGTSFRGGGLIFRVVSRGGGVYSRSSYSEEIYTLDFTVF